MNKDLKDVQNLKDTRGVDIQKVGIKANFSFIIQRKNESNQVVSAKARMTVSSKTLQGTIMSRFIEVLCDRRTKTFLGST